MQEGGANWQSAVMMAEVVVAEGVSTLPTFELTYAAAVTALYIGHYYCFTSH